MEHGRDRPAEGNVTVRPIVRYLNEVYKRFFKFGLVGLSGTVVDFGTLYLLNTFFPTQAGLLGWMNLFVAVSFELSVINNFLWSYFWVWRDRRRSFALSFLAYNLSTGVAFLIRLAVFNLGIAVTQADPHQTPLVYWVVVCLSVGAAVLVNFLFIEHAVFGRRRAKERDLAHGSE